MARLSGITGEATARAARLRGDYGSSEFWTDLSGEADAGKPAGEPRRSGRRDVRVAMDSLPRKPSLGAPIASNQAPARQPPATRARARRKPAARALGPKIHHCFVRRPRSDASASSATSSARFERCFGGRCPASMSKPTQRPASRLSGLRGDGFHAWTADELAQLRGPLASRHARAAGVRYPAVDRPATRRRGPRRATARQERLNHPRHGKDRPARLCADPAASRAINRGDAYGRRHVYCEARRYSLW